MSNNMTKFYKKKSLYISTDSHDKFSVNKYRMIPLWKQIFPPLSLKQKVHDIENSYLKKCLKPKLKRFQVDKTVKSIDKDMIDIVKQR